jgi:hypothetical protein
MRQTCRSEGKYLYSVESASDTANPKLSFAMFKPAARKRTSRKERYVYARLTSFKDYVAVSEQCVCAEY